ncbi:nuclear transport factor 2 family protein [Halorussus ruber]|uniref:nuclear transport factor 2 family protein n=1 Tax=Halorussus ruber TaxID=1126238 RepID=UPI001092E2BB|nr:nuclear transport factor 2 family protein [Halorussus ruber]
MNPTETVEEYYEALRRGEPLSPYFAEREDAVKFGVSERLAGYEAISEGLREQTRTTEDWRVESRNLGVVVRDSVAWFTDDVALSWTASEGADSEAEQETRYSFDTRWSGVLERESSDDESSSGKSSSGKSSSGESNSDESSSGKSSGDSEEPRWRFVQMHVSAPHEL